MANFAFQVTGAFQGNGQFAFQGGTAAVTVQPGTFNLRFKRRKKKKEPELVQVEVLTEKEYSPPELEPIEALAKELAEHGIPITKLLIEYEEDFDEEDALIQATKVLLQ